MQQRLPLGGSPLIVTIRADRFWNPTGVLVTHGEVYDFCADGEWTDLFVRTTPDGVTTSEAPWLARPVYRLFEGKRRAPHERWFALLGAVGHDDSSAFLIGRRRNAWVAAATGELQCFANDYPHAYWNNRGTVRLTIVRRA